MIPYQTGSPKLSGTSFAEVKKKALGLSRKIERKTRRKLYILSNYFRTSSGKRKIFFDYFWKHLYQKILPERTRRLKYLKCALELIENSRNAPEVISNPKNKSESLYRFGGLTKGGELFYVQVKEDKKTGKLDFMSVFPEK